MPTPFKTYVARDALLLAALNALMNAAYTAWLWRGQPLLPLYGDLAVARDLAMTPVMIALLSTLLGTAAARAKLSDGRVAVGEARAPELLRALPASIVTRALLLALLAAVLLATPLWLALCFSGKQALTPHAAVGLKAGITAVMTLGLVPLVIHAALADVQPAAEPRWAT